LDLLLLLILAFILILIIVIIYSACEYGGLNQGGVIAAVASPLASALDLWNGNNLGTTFVGVCSTLGSVSK
jgi:hypothetical protein